MLIEYDLNTNEVVSATFFNISGAMYDENMQSFIMDLHFSGELPAGSGSCRVLDIDVARDIWASHFTGANVTITSIVDGIVTAAVCDPPIVVSTP